MLALYSIGHIWVDGQVLCFHGTYILIQQLLIYVSEAYQELFVVHGRFQRLIKFCSLAWGSLSLTVWREINPFLPETYCATRDVPCRLKAGMPCSGQPKWLSLGAQARENSSSCDCPQLLLNDLNEMFLCWWGMLPSFLETMWSYQGLSEKLSWFLHYTPIEESDWGER